ncbi:MAG TPA: ribonuclease, partial [Thermotoga sp.]|nr:ribonuclease [Thermotoga sp.]
MEEVGIIKQLLINVVGENVSGVILEDGRLYEVFSEEIESIRGNIYLGKVEKIVPALDAAFVNIGKGKNAFLRLKDLTKAYISTILGGKKISEGSKVLVQVKKDALGNKGPQVTTKISLAGHFLVFFPFSKAKGISKKIFDKDERNRLKSILKKLLKE